MRTCLSFVLIFTGVFFSTPDISMMGLRINDPKTALKTIRLKVLSKEDETIRYRAENGNDFSITLDDGSIVFMENDRVPGAGGDEPLISNFRFGKTSLKDIRKAFGSNGYSYDERVNMTTDADLVEFNCFEFDSPNNEVMVTITKASLDQDLSGDKIPESLKLDGIIIADAKFMEDIWGKRKHYSTGYKKITADELQGTLPQQ